MRRFSLLGLFAGLICAVCVSFGLLGATASANPPVFVSSFNGGGTPAGSLGDPNGIAIDVNSGDVYVADIEHELINKFTSTGTFICQITGSATPSASECNGVAGSATPAGGFAFPNSADNPAAIAVDNTPGSPSEGDLYVMDEGHETVDKFSPTGAYLGSITGPSSANFSEIYGASTDSAGDLWVFEQNFSADEFSGDVSNEFVGSWDNGEFGSERGFAAGPVGEGYAIRGCDCVEKISQLGRDLGQVDTSSSDRALTVDLSTGRLYIDDGSFISEWDTSAMSGPGASGVQVGEFGSLQLTDSGQGGIAVNPDTGEIYVSNPTDSSVYIFGPPPPAVPTIGPSAISSASATSAHLSSTITPNGSATSYRVEYGSTPAYGQQTAEASAGSGQEPVAVSQALEGLASGVEYHFRFVATNSQGTIFGSDQTLRTYAHPTAESCPNEQFRTGFSAGLPDCRAFEVVSEADGDDTENIVGMFGYPDGKHAFYESFTPIRGTAQSGDPEVLLATRTDSGWQSAPISPPQGTGHTTELTNFGTSVTFTSDFSTAFIDSPFDADPLDQDHGWDVYGVSLASGISSLASLPDSGPMLESYIKQPSQYEVEVQGPGAWLAGNSVDGSQVFFVSTGKIPTAQGTPVDTHIASNEIYDRTGEHTYLVGVLPDGTVPPCGAEVGQAVESSVVGETKVEEGAIAPDGSNVVFHTPGPEANEVPACAGESYPSKAGDLYLRDVTHGTTVQLPGLLFGGRTKDGSKIITLGEKEGNGSTDEIYEYEISTGRTLTVGVGDLLAYSADGSRVYYQSTDPSKPGLYVYDSGTESSTLLPGTESGGYAGGSINNTEETKTSSAISDMSVTTSNGSELLFIDTAKLTKYDNEGHREAYIYDANSNSVTCISCNPSGAVPTGNADLIEYQYEDYHPFHTPSPPFISNDGSRAVFETTESLVPQDTNGLEDVYEWENGQVYLLSSGLGSVGTYLLGASEEVDDVYMQTNDALVPGLDNSVHIYDARVDGGFGSTTVLPGCAQGACTGAASRPSVLSPPASASFAGSGNLKLPVAAKKAAKRSKKKSKKSKKKRAKKPEKGGRRKRGKKAVEQKHAAMRRIKGGRAQRANRRVVKAEL